MKISIVIAFIVVILTLPACTRSADFEVNKPSASLPVKASQAAIIKSITTLTITPTPTPTPIPTKILLPDDNLKRGDRDLFNGDWESALNEYQTARNASQDPLIQSAALLGIGHSQLLAGNYYEAVNVLENLLQEYPDSPQQAMAYFLLGQAYEKQEHFLQAADKYLNYLVNNPGIIDAYLLDLRGDALFSAGNYAEAASDYQAASNSPSTLDEILLQMKMARSYALSGDSAAAISIYDDLSFKTTNENTLSLISLRKGQAYLSLGREDLATESYLEAVNKYPTSIHSYDALLTLVEQGTTVNELKRGIVDYHAGQYGVALAALDRYLQEMPEDPATAYYYYGLTSRALGGYEDAIENWETIIQEYPDHELWDDAWEQKAYTLWAFMDQNSMAIENLLKFSDSVPSHPRAAEFLYDAAQIAVRSNEFNQAAELYQRVANLYPEYSGANRALYLSGISQYQLEDYQEALNPFQRYLSISNSLEDRAAAYLWIGKTQMTLGDPAKALENWQLSMSTDPTGYYSERAGDILRDNPPFNPPVEFDIVYDEAKEKEKAEQWIITTFGLAADTDLSTLGDLSENDHLQRGTELWNLGMQSEAREEFEQLRQSLLSDAANSYRLANYLAEIGLYRSAILTSRQILELALLDDAATMNTPPYFNHLRFGTYFADLIIPTAQELGFHPLFLFSVVRQESLFESFIRSPMSASGLMQIIPSTGEEIARNLGWPEDYSSDDLNRPLISIRFGSEYLDLQRTNFDGDLYAALAAYNGGPGNASLWRSLAPNDQDVFLEIINYPETRNYIRVIYEVFNIYRRLYDRSP